MKVNWFHRFHRSEKVYIDIFFAQIMWIVKILNNWVNIMKLIIVVNFDSNIQF